MRLAVLGSGSAGNSLMIESSGHRLLVDAGFSARQIGKRMESLGEDLSQFNTVLLTHEHQDHSRGVDVLQRRHGFRAYATEGTRQGCRPSAKTEGRWEVIRSGQPFEVVDSHFSIEAFQIPHDAREPVGYVIEDRAGCRVGLVADLGCRSQLAWGRLLNLDALILETNHDLQMLRKGPYPWHLKQRVASRHGHLSNHEAAAGLGDLVDDRLRNVVLYHLSRTNNLPALAAQTIAERLEKLGSKADILVTRQDEASPWIQIARPASEIGEKQ